MSYLYSRNFARALRTSVLFLGAAFALLLHTALRPALAATTTTVGEQSTVVLLVTYSDRPVQPMTRDAAHAMVFGEANDFYWQASYGRMTLTGDTFGYFTIPVSSTTCSTALVSQEADKAATAAGIDLSKYAHRIYIAPSNACSGTGYNSGMTLPTRTYLFNDLVKAENVVHEFGHNLGLSHSQALECGSAIYGSDTECSRLNYGDPADAMGGGGTTQYNGFQKELLGWLTASGSQSIKTVTATGRYRIERFEDGTGIKALKIARAPSDNLAGDMNYYYLEYRQPVGVDAPLGSTANLTKGVLLHTGGVNQYSFYLDSTPNSTAWTSDDVRDAAFVPGRTYRDDAAGLAFTVVSADATGATVDVTIGPGATQPPPPASVTLTESVGTDKTAYVRSETVALSALVKGNGAAVAGATVKFAIASPAGTTNVTAMTGADGFARATYRIGKARNALGSYSVRADATSNGSTATASTAFSVR
jgi:hypothetical protein